MKRYVIPANQLPSRPPVMASALAYMALDLYGAPGWVWGVACTLFALLWVLWLVVLVEEEAKPLPGYGKTRGQGHDTSS